MLDYCNQTRPILECSGHHHKHNVGNLPIFYNVLWQKLRKFNNDLTSSTIALYISLIYQMSSFDIQCKNCKA